MPSSAAAPAKAGAKRRRQVHVEVEDPRAHADAVMHEEAVSRGVIASSLPSSYPRLPPGKAFKAVDGSDIYRKGGHRKAKFLFVLPGRLHLLASAGTLGQLEALDTPHPTLTIQFPPKGSLKLTGSIMRSSARFMTLQLHPGAASRGASAISAGGRAPIVAEDVFDRMVVFSQAAWTPAPGSAPSTDDANELLQQAADASAKHAKRSPTAYAAWHGCAAMSATGAAAASSGKRAVASSAAPTRNDSVGSEVQSSQRSRRASASKAVKYAVSDDEDEDGDGDEDESVAEANDDDDEDDDDDEASADEVEEVEAVKAPRARSRKRAKPAVEEDDVEDEAGVSEVIVTRAARPSAAAIGDVDATPSLARLPAAVTPFRSVYASSSAGFATTSKSMWSSPPKAAPPMHVDEWMFDDDAPAWSRPQATAAASSSGATALPAWLTLDAHMPASSSRPIITLSDDDDEDGKEAPALRREVAVGTTKRRAAVSDKKQTKPASKRRSAPRKSASDDDDDEDEGDENSDGDDDDDDDFLA